MFYCFPKLCTGVNRYCREAVNSVEIVESCPKSKAEWDDAARRKDCSSIASKQNCTTAEKFQYHCVINGYRNVTLEVCAPTRIIFGNNLFTLWKLLAVNFNGCFILCLKICLLCFYDLRALRRVQRSWWSNTRSAISTMQRNISQMSRNVQLMGSLQM